MGGPVSLKTEALQTRANWLGIKIDRQMALDLSVIEDEALREMGKKA